MYELAFTPPLVTYDPRKGENPKGGKTFYVREGSTGNDSYEGTDPEYPLATIERALTNSTASRGDYIFIQYFSTLDAPPLTINKRALHIIALSSGNFDSRNDLNGGSSVSLNIETAGRDLELAGFNIGNDGTTYGIEVSAGQVMYRCHIHHCTIGNNFTTTDGIHAVEISQSSIDNCLFGTNGTGITGDGLAVNSYVMTFLVNNIFMNITEKAIDLAAVSGGSIHGNMFYAPIASAESDGWAINIVSGHSVLVMNNYASQTGDDQGNNPYKDTSTGTITDTTNGWCYNWSGETHTKPAVS